MFWNLFNKKEKEEKKNYTFEEYKKDIVLFVELYNSTNTKVKLIELQSICDKILDNTRDLRFVTSGLKAYQDGQKLAYLISAIKEISYTKHWLKTFGLVGLNDLRSTRIYSYTDRKEKIVLNIKIKPLSLVRYDKIMSSNKKPFLQNKELKRVRRLNSYKRKINRLNTVLEY